MTGDQTDFAGRLRAVLPGRWFSSATPVLDTLLGAFGAAWAAIYAMFGYVRAQTRLATATDSNLDLIGQDFFAARLARLVNEGDDAYRARISAALTCDHATRAALSAGLQALTGSPPIIFEPSRPADTGSYNAGGLAYGTAGAWGSLVLPFQLFLTVRRPQAPGIAVIAGYGTGGPLARAGSAQIGSRISDTDILAATQSLLPTASTAWTRITD